LPEPTRSISKFLNSALPTWLKLTVLPKHLLIALAVFAVACTPVPEKPVVAPAIPDPVIEPKTTEPAVPPVQSDQVVVPEIVVPVLVALNKFRVANGLSRLDFDNRLATAATGHADAMAAADFFSHTGANGSSLSKRVSDVGYPWRLVAENVAAGMQDGGEAVAVWIDSPGHRKNMLTAGLTHAGIGYVRASPDLGKVAYEHYWVLVMGAPLKN
jgi:uncharacterized protein YkwD